jgi:hypothetical protein
MSCTGLRCHESCLLSVVLLLLESSKVRLDLVGAGITTPGLGIHILQGPDTHCSRQPSLGLVLGHSEVFKRLVGGEHSAGKKKLTQ